jgi:hypothetical protein
VSVELYDDDDGADEANGAERGTITFVLNQVTPPGPLINPFLATFSADELNSPDGRTFADPVVVSGGLCDCDLDPALVEILVDGTFFVRVNRRGGSTPTDFFVKGPPEVLIDGEFVPEPASVALTGLGLGAVGLLGRRLRTARR